MSSPPAWQLVKSRTNSVAGRLLSEGLQLHYDFGRYSDPLRVPPGAMQVQEDTVSTAGMPARRVRYALKQARGVPMHYLGVYLPQVRHSRMGWLKLTLLADAEDPARLAEVEAVMSTVQIKPAPASSRAR